jgi:hypothetical protein
VLRQIKQPGELGQFRTLAGPGRSRGARSAASNSLADGIRQIEAKALRNLKHASRSMILSGFLDN